MKNPKHLLPVLASLLLLATPAHAQLQPPDNSLLFNGMGQSVVVTNFGTIAPSTEITVEVWINANVVAGQTAFAMNFGTPTDRFAASISYTGTSDFWDFGNINGTGPGRLALPKNPIGQWTHYAFVVSQSGNFMGVYTNGVPIASKTGMSPFVRGNYDLYLGGAGPNGMGFNGYLDEFRVWNTVRSQTQILANYTNTLVGNEPGLLLYYKFDATNGNIATNFATATGPTYNGTLLNNPTWSSAPFVVTNLADSGPGTLRQAVSNTFGSKITFDPALSGQTILLTNGQIMLTRSVTIDASALPNGIRLDGHASSRIFQISSPVNITLNSLTLTNGHQTSGNFFNNGGAILNQTGNLTVINCAFANNAEPFGGAIFNDSSSGLNLNHCTFTGNQASATGIGGAFGGGAIFNNGEATAINCTFTGNSSFGGAGGAIFSGSFGDQNAGFTANGCLFSANFITNGGQGGGAIFNESTLTLLNTTFFGNQASTTVTEGGGAIYNFGTLAITNCTIFGNQATTTGTANGGNYGGIEAPNFTSIPVNNSIVCSNTANGISANVSPTYTSGVGNLVDTNPQLLPLGNYGGPTLSMPPMPGSPAIDAGNDAIAASLATDQRGLPRHVGSHVDIGAVEIQNAQTLPATGVTAVAAILNGSTTTNGSYYFAYGLTTNYTSFTPTNTITAPNVSAAIVGLPNLTTYHYQLIVTNTSGKSLGGDQTFTTLILPTVSGFTSQIVGTNTVTGTASVVLYANVNPSATLTFAYGLTSAYGALSSPVTLPLSPPGVIFLGTGINNLAPGRTYHWAAIATNAGGTTIGPDQTFTLAGGSGSGSGIPGDTDGDGIISASEFNAVLGNYLAASPYLLITNAVGLGQSNVTFGLSNSLAGNFTVQFSTNQTTWSDLGPAKPFYFFTDTNASTAPQRYYRLKYP